MSATATPTDTRPDVTAAPADVNEDVHHHGTNGGVPVGAIVTTLCGFTHRKRPATIVRSFPCCPMCNVEAARMGEPCRYRTGRP